MFKFSVKQVCKLLEKGVKLPLAIRNYPSRGQTAVQDLYETSQGKFFLKKSSKQNHIDCQVDPKIGTLAEREYWAFCVAKKLGLKVPELWLLDEYTTVQRWFDISDAHQYTTSEGKMTLKSENVFDCALFDWVTGQVDRHDANYLYDCVKREIILIDSAYAFLKYTGSIPDYLKYFEVSSPMELKKVSNSFTQEAWKSFSGKSLSKWVPIRGEEEKQAFLKRWEQVCAVSSIQNILDLYRGQK